MAATSDSTLDQSHRRDALAHAARELDRVRDVLHTRYQTRLQASDIDRVVEQLAPSFLASPVLDYVGVLVERAARRELDLIAAAPTS